MITMTATRYRSSLQNNVSVFPWISLRVPPWTLVLALSSVVPLLPGGITWACTCETARCSPASGGTRPT
jgi:hypothetical protein